jgi:UDPglucose--hexose-1-phosphate uridylyltransferase
LRVVRNRFSALDDTHSVHRRQRGRFLVSDSYGAAEVIVESPVHGEALHEMPVERIERVLRAYRERALAIAAMQNIAIVMAFRNHGPVAGTSLIHPHSQIIASPIIPPHIRDPFQKAALHYDSYGSCVYCDMVEEEMLQAERIVEANEDMVAFCPFASRTPYELRIYPLRHCATFVWITDDEIRSFAVLLRATIRRIMAVLGNPSYNYIIRSAPIGDEDVRYLHWYFVLIPKVSTPAGFEIGSGIYINSTAPEDCAARLRDAL